MSNVDINVDRRTDGQKIGRLYRTLLQAGAIKRKNSGVARQTYNFGSEVMSKYLIGAVQHHSVPWYNSPLLR